MTPLNPNPSMRGEAKAETLELPGDPLALRTNTLVGYSMLTDAIGNLKGA